MVTTGTRSTPTAPRDTRSPALRHLQAVLVRALRGAGSQTGALVVDLSDPAALFSMRAQVARPPASVEKLYTSVALLALLGPRARLHTTLLGTGHAGPGGVWHGDLYLRGDGDPTFGDGSFNQIYEAGYGPTAGQLVAVLRRAGIRRVTGRVYGDESRFDSARGGPATREQPDTPDYGGELSALVYDHGATGRGLTPGAFAARELVRTMRLAHLRASAARRSARTPPGAHVLATVASPPLPVLLRLMDVPSDDLFADLLTKQLGYRLLGHGTLSAGAIEIRQAIGERYGIHPAILDGSGLDGADRSTPAQVVALLREAWGTPSGDELQASLPVVGRTGTVASLGIGTPAQGHCVAKTGTLNGVSNLAGLCAARGGHELAFALFVDGPENWQGFAMLSKMVGAIAAY
jgi:D-alanyl-D-alanine carboxypeptidase/D-alanyl-D-alanine-endopeptidase (penicillin-binding protein 4)